MENIIIQDLLEDEFFIDFTKEELEELINELDMEE